MLRRILLVLVATLCAATTGAAQTVVWQDGFEGSWTDRWYSDFGTWEVGEATSGPGGAFAGENVAATNLGGNYNENIDSRLIAIEPFVVPAASENPRLRYWHWYSFSVLDSSKVQVSVDGGETWETISPVYSGTGGGVWTRPLLDLSPYAGQSVLLAFYFRSRQSGSRADVSTGWYIDDVVIEPVERAPVAERDDVATNEDEALDVAILGNDQNVNDGPLTLTVTRDPTHGTAQVRDGGTPDVPEDDVITYTPAADYNGPDDFIYQVDDGQATDTAVVYVTVRPVNDAPSFTGEADQDVDEDAGPQAVEGWATDISTGPGNETNQTPSFEVVANSNPALFAAGPAVSADGTLAYTSAPNAFGEAIVSIVLKDGGGTANGGTDTSTPQSFVITVRPVNDPPAAAVTTPAHGATLPVEGAPETPFEVSWSVVEDVDGDDVTYAWQLSTTSDFVELRMDEDVGGDTLFGTDYRALDSLLDESGVPTGGSLLLYHRIISSDEVSDITGATSTFTITRGVLTDTEDVGELPERFVLHGAYPNPFNLSTTLRFDLPDAAAVSLHVYDALGRLVLQRPLGRLAAGAGHDVRVDAAELQSGVYLYRLTALLPGETAARTGRFVLVK